MMAAKKTDAERRTAERETDALVGQPFRAAFRASARNSRTEARLAGQSGTDPQTGKPCPTRSHKKLFKRAGPDRSQLLRRSFQLLFLTLNIWIAADFYRFVRFYETGGRTSPVSRPPGVEGWLPIASLMNLKVWLLTGALPRLHPAGMFLLTAFLAMSWLFRKSFCS